MARITATVGSRVVFDTDKGRLIANFIDVPASSSRGTEDDIYFTIDGLFLTCPATKKPGESIATPLTSEHTTVLDSNNVYLRLSQSGAGGHLLSLGRDDRSEDVFIDDSSSSWNAYGLLIYRFSDDVWCPVFFLQTSENSIIPATSNAYGAANWGTDSVLWPARTSTVFERMCYIGEGLKNAGTGVVPYDGLPVSITGGNEGTYDFISSDTINYPVLPSLSAVTTGFISLWAPTEAQMLTLSEYMWNADPLTINFWKKLFADPLQLIYGLNIIPLDLHNMTPAVIDVAQNVVIGIIDTKIPMDHLNTQWVELDCGSIAIDETWGAYLDYDPYTKLEIYLPYCGMHPLKVDDFMPGSISVKYHIDLLTGSCVALVKSTKSNVHGDMLDSVVYQFMGNCATQIPVTASQFADAVRSAVSIAASIGNMVAVGVAGSAAAGSAKTPEIAGDIKARASSKKIMLGASAVENVMSLKPSIERSGAIGSSGGMLAIQTPYLILTRPRQVRPESQSVYTGYPSFITETLGDLNGWTIIQAIHLDNIPCTSEELEEIDGLLKAGVIF